MEQFFGKNVGKDHLCRAMRPWTPWLASPVSVQASSPLNIPVAQASASTHRRFHETGKVSPAFCLSLAPFSRILRTFAQTREQYYRRRYGQGGFGLRHFLHRGGGKKSAPVPQRQVSGGGAALGDKQEHHLTEILRTFAQTTKSKSLCSTAEKGHIGWKR